MSTVYRIALLQFPVTADRDQNVHEAVTRIKKVVTQEHPKIVVLPECFNSPYEVKAFGTYAETIPGGYTCLEMAKVAKECGIFLVAGSIPERDQGKIYNTCTVWSPKGELVAKHRKCHLFDMDIPGVCTFQESKVLTPGDSFTTFQVDKNLKVGLGVCYDIRFDEFARCYRNMGCDLLIYPGAFDLYTGPMHWQLLARGRALDTQCYVAGVSQTRDDSAGYIAYGHSCLVDPWGRVVKSAEFGEATIVADIDTSVIKQVRQQIPVGMQRRPELYKKAN